MILMKIWKKFVIRCPTHGQFSHQSNSVRKLHYALEPFPRLAAQTVRCKACCERLLPPNSVNVSTSSMSSSGFGSNNSSMEKLGPKNKESDAERKFTRRSYKVNKLKQHDKKASIVFNVHQFWTSIKSWRWNLLKLRSKLNIIRNRG